MSSERTVTFGVACSLDGFIAGEDDDVDWLRWTPDVAALSGTYWKTIDTVLMGRRTWERAPAGGYPGVANYVASRTWTRSPHAAVRLVEGDAAPFLERLRRQPGKGICVLGGGDLARSLLAAALIDVLALNVHPVLLGRGIPLFHALPRSIALERRECRPLAEGCVYLTYAVRP